MRLEMIKYPQVGKCGFVRPDVPQVSRGRRSNASSVWWMELNDIKRWKVKDDLLKASKKRREQKNDLDTSELSSSINVEFR